MALSVHIDGTDVSGVALTGSATRRLNRPSLAQVKLPMDAAIGGANSKLKIDFGSGLFHHGRVLQCEVDAGEDDGYVVYNSSDPMELWASRPVRDDTCDFSKPEIITDYVTGPQILEAMLTNTVSCGGDTDAEREGPIFLTMGSFATGGVDLSGAPVDWPMTIAELTSLLISTGELDVVITPSDPGGGVMGTVDAYNGNFGTDLSGSVAFEYATGARNVRGLRWNEDMTNVCNKLWYYGGPRVQTPADPAGDQHWCWNITGDDCCFTGVDNPPDCVCLSPDQADMETAFGSVDTCRDASRSAHGVRMDVKIWDALGTSRCLGPGAVDPGRELYRWLWLTESWIRCQPRTLVHITPTRGTGIEAFDIGDLITVTAGSAVKGGFSGAQRVYGYTISWDEDGPFELSEIQTSADNEGL